MSDSYQSICSLKNTRSEIYINFVREANVKTAPKISVAKIKKGFIFPYSAIKTKNNNLISRKKCTNMNGTPIILLIKTFNNSCVWVPFAFLLPFANEKFRIHFKVLNHFHADASFMLAFSRFSPVRRVNKN